MAEAKGSDVLETYDWTGSSDSDHRARVQLFWNLGTLIICHGCSFCTVLYSSLIDIEMHGCGIGFLFQNSKKKKFIINYCITLKCISKVRVGQSHYYCAKLNVLPWLFYRLYNASINVYSYLALVPQA